jgi:hypothetical protein
MATTTDRMDADTGALASFGTSLPAPDALPADPVVNPGLMAGAAMTTASIGQAAAAYRRFHTDATAGFESFKQIALVCAADYDNADQTNAEAIARTAAARPEQVAVVDKLNNDPAYANRPPADPDKGPDRGVPTNFWDVRR